MGKTIPDDTLELRNSFIENCMTDEWGNKVKQAELHLEIQGTLFRWDQEGYREAMISAPFGGGKSQQLPIGLGTYFQTRVHEESQLIVTASPKLSIKRIKSIRAMVDSEEYERWCIYHHMERLIYAKEDSGSSESITFKSKNRTGNPSFEASGIDSGGTGQRAWRLWGDDTADKKDFGSEATRKSRHNSWTKTWSPRVYDGGYTYIIRTPYHPEDTNEKLIKSGIFNHLEIAVREDKTGYDVREYKADPDFKLVREEIIPLWLRNHSVTKLEKAEAEDYTGYQLGYCMKKEVQNPQLSTYLGFSSAEYPEGNVSDCFFDDMCGNPLVLTCDFNVNPMSWVLGQKQGDNYVVLIECIGENVTTENHANKVAQIILDEGHTHVELRGDGTSNQGGKRYGRSGENDWTVLCKVLENYGITYTKKVKRSNPARDERVKVVSNVIYSELSGVPERHLIIDRSCTTVIEDYKFSVRDDNELKKKKQGKRGHVSDAVDYWVYGDKKGRKTRILI